MPDEGPIVLLTRPRTASARFAAALAGHIPSDVTVLIAPVIEISPVGHPLDTSGWPTLVFTSANAVSQALSAPGKTAFCVGATTAAAASGAGFDARSADGNADDLVRMLRQSKPKVPILHLRGAHGASLAHRLTRAGFQTDEQVVYRQVDANPDPDILQQALTAPRVIAPIFSPRSARRLRQFMMPSETLKVVSISQAAQVAWGGPALVAKSPTSEAMLATVLDALDSDSPY